MNRLGPYDLNTIVVGDCLEVLRQMPDGVFQMCATSPPYWGLRDYGIPPVVHGGDPLCEHDWGAEVVTDHRGTQLGKAITVDAREATRGQFCLRCGAWLGSLGLEPTPELYVEHIVGVFREVRRVLRDDGTLWLNMGDSYATGGYQAHDKGAAGNPHCPAGWAKSARAQGAMRTAGLGGLKPKDLIGVPWRVALALQADGWWLRSDIIWAKPNCMPESVRDRPTKSHEYVFLMSKSKRYFYDQDAIREPHARMWNPETLGGNLSSGTHKLSGKMVTQERATPAPNPAGRNKRTVWTIPTHPFPEAHFATFPVKLVEPMIKAGTSERGACPECGKAWVRVVEKIDKGCGVRGYIPSDDRCFGNTQRSGPGSGALSVKFKTLGWQPACSCNAGDPIPCVVLDPFAGAGTTPMVADGLGRDWLGIEINAAYVEMALERIEGDRKKRAQLELQFMEVM